MPDPETFNLEDDHDLDGPHNVGEDNTVPAPNPLYERQVSLELSCPSVMIVGVGGVGCWIALSLALGGIEHLTLWDGDTLSTHNLNRFPLPMTKVGELKSVALADWLNSLRPRADRIAARGEFDTNLHTEVYADWLVCATDSLKSRKMCYEYAIGNRMKYLEVGADGERWSMSPKPPEFSTELEEAPGYQTVPVHVGPCMMAGAAVSYYILHDTVPHVSHLVDWDKGPVFVDHHSRGGLDIESLDETIGEKDSEGNWTCERGFGKCPKCRRDIERDRINGIRHLRYCMGLSLVGASNGWEAIITTAAIEAMTRAQDEVPMTVELGNITVNHPRAGTRIEGITAGLAEPERTENEQ